MGKMIDAGLGGFAGVAVPVIAGGTSAAAGYGAANAYQALTSSSSASKALKGLDGISSSNVGSNLGSVDWSPLADAIKTAFSDFSSSAVDAEKKAAEVANAFTEKMWKKTADWNDDQTRKANEFTEYLMKLQNDLNLQNTEDSIVAYAEGLRKAGINPALLGSFGGASGFSPSGSSATTSMNAPSGSKANPSSGYSVQERLISSVLDTVISVLIARESNATKLTSDVINGAFGLVGAVLPRTSFRSSSNSNSSTSTNYNYNEYKRVR